MNFKDYIDELMARLKIEVDTARPEMGRKINLAYQEISNNANFNWEALKRTSEIRLTPNYTAGTVTVTLDSRTVTGSGTAWTAAMQGRYFKAQGSDQWYKIAYVVSATELTLQTPIAEASASGKTYAIWKRFYYVHSEVRKILNMGSWIRDGVIQGTSDTYLMGIENDISRVGPPDYFTVHGVDPYVGEYSTGTVDATEDSDILTGTGTSWLDNAEPGDLIKIGASHYYRVKRVESDTRIVMLNKALVSVDDEAYTITKDDPLGFQLFSNADKSYVIPYQYVKRAYDMVNDEDRTELPPEFDLAIIDGAEASRMRDMDDAKWINKLAEYSGRIRDLKASGLVMQPKFRQFRRHIPERGTY